MIPQIIPPSDLIEGAICRKSDPDMWYPHEGDCMTRDIACAACEVCPVLDLCAAYCDALHAEDPHLICDGIWAGTYYTRAGTPGRICDQCGCALPPRKVGQRGNMCDECRMFPGNCIACGRPTRARDVDIADAPGTVVWGGVGPICETCRARRREGRQAC